MLSVYRYIHFSK